MSSSDAGVLRTATDRLQSARFAVEAGRLEQARGCIDSVITDLDILLAIAGLPSWSEAELDALEVPEFEGLNEGWGR